MSSNSPNPRRPSKRRATIRSKHSTIDLNSPPPIADITHPHADVTHRASTSQNPRADIIADVIDVGSSSSSSSASRRFRNPRGAYISGDVIDLDWTPSITYERVVLTSSYGFRVEEEAQMVAQPEPRFTPQAPIVVLDEEEETNPQSTGIPSDVINLDLSLDLQLLGSKRNSFTNPNPNPNSIPAPIPQPPAPKKEPTFNCPVCMNTLTDASSTICGHIFCKECITMAIKAQKKCPTCRRKLNAGNFHRVYLPCAE